jgi:hypothetical protein
MVMHSEAGRNLVCIHAYCADSVHNLIKELRFALPMFRALYGKTTWSVQPFLSPSDATMKNEGLRGDE